MTMSATTLDADSAFTSTWVGMLLCFIFYGGTVGQTMFYLHNFRRDPVLLKTLVVFLGLFDSAKNLIHAQLLWYWFSENHSNSSILLLLPTSYTVHFILSAATIFGVQSLYIHNIWTLLAERPYRKWMTSVGVVLALLSLVCGFIAAYDIFSSNTDVSAIARVNVSGRIQGYSTLAVDFYITASLFFIFHGARTGHETTETILSKLMAYIVTRGVLLCMVQLLVIVTYKPSGTQAMDGVYCFAGTLNVNTALAALNARRRVNQMDDSDANLKSAPMFVSPETSFRVRRSSFSTVGSDQADSTDDSRGSMLRAHDEQTEMKEKASE